MRYIMFAALTATAAAFSGMLPSRAGAEGASVISGPVTHGNLAIYFVHGEEAPGRVTLTLQEAMAKGTVRVAETGSVNELRIENSGDEDVYIQSGDIVKGGRQDRVLTVSFVLPRSRARSRWPPIAWSMAAGASAGRRTQGILPAPPMRSRRARQSLR